MSSSDSPYFFGGIFSKNTPEMCHIVPNGQLFFFVIKIQIIERLNNNDSHIGLYFPHGKIARKI